jgi:hypothetical protein
MSKRFLRNTAIGLWVMCVFFAPGDQVFSAELRQFEPFVPSERPSSRAPNAMNRSMVEESVYKNFDAEVRQLGPGDKKKLVESFTQKLNAARSMQQWGEAEHYQQLLDILRKYK